MTILLKRCAAFACDRTLSELRWVLGYRTCARHSTRRAPVPRVTILVKKCAAFACDRTVSELRWALGHRACARHGERGASVARAGGCVSLRSGERRPDGESREILSNGLPARVGGLAATLRPLTRFAHGGFADRPLSNP